MKPELTVPFQNSRPDAPRLSMMQAIAHAKAALATMTVLQFDSVGRCERQPEGRWTITLDLIESMARMGDNDLLATYEVDLDAEGEPLNMMRTRRYHREDRDQS